MRPGVPAAWLAICVAIAAPGSIRAQEPERLPVAVIDLSEDEQVRGLSNQIYAVVNDSPVLKVPPSTRTFEPFLTGKLFDEDASPTSKAHDYLVSAENQLSQQINAVAAERDAREGMRLLAQVMPTSETQLLYADLAFVLGHAALDEHKAQDASLAFALVHRLDPARKPDGVKYPPDVLAAYDLAAAAHPATYPLEIKGEGRVWVDFVERGPAPGTFEGFEAGEHVVVVTGAELETLGEPIIVTGPMSKELQPARASDELLAKRARLELSRAQARHDDMARAIAMKKLAKLLGVGDVVMISKRDGKLQWETWKDRAPGFSAPKLITNQKPEELLEGLAPPRKVEPVKVTPAPVKPTPVHIETPWYRERWVQASAAATVIGAIIGGIIWARRDHMLGVDSNIQVGGM